MAYTPDYWQSQLNTWRGAKAYESANPNMLRPSGLGRTYGDTLVQQQGIGAASQWAPARNAFGAQTADPAAAGYARYRNDLAASSPLVTDFGGYLERNKGVRAGDVLRDLAAGSSAYDSFLPEFLDWRGRETTRSNAQGFSGFNSLIRAVGPALVTGGATLPLAGKAAIGAAFGGISGGPVGALTGAAASALAPNLKMPGFRAAVRAPLQAARSIASQALQPANALRLAASRGVSAATPTSGRPNYLARVSAQLGGRR